MNPKAGTKIERYFRFYINISLPPVPTDTDCRNFRSSTFSCCTMAYFYNLRTFAF